LTLLLALTLLLHFVLCTVYVELINTSYKDVTLSALAKQQKQKRTMAPQTLHLDPLDPNVRPRRLRRFNPANTSFPAVKFHGCNDRGLCQLSDVCFSGHDGMIVFGTNNSEWKRISESKLGSVTMPRRPMLVPWSGNKLRNVYFAKRMFVLNCWRQKHGKLNPAHMLMGEGKLFTLSSGTYNDDVHNVSNKTPLDLVLYHHCSGLEGWAWGEMLHNLFWEDAVLQGLISPPIDGSGNYEDAKIFMPYAAGKKKRDNDVVICGETVWQEPFSVAKYFGANHPNTTGRWEERLNDYIKEKQQTNGTSTEKAKPNVVVCAADETGGKVGGKKTKCSQNLRVAIWKRTEGSALRNFMNMEEIEDLVSEYSNCPAQTLTANAATSPEEQMMMFRSFDILITCHGSHLANMIFNGRKSVFIEASAVFYNNDFNMNGPSFAKKWIMSFGHLPHNNLLLAKKQPDCLLDERMDPKSICPNDVRLQFKQSNIILNTTVLRNNLESAIATLCTPPAPANITENGHVAGVFEKILTRFEKILTRFAKGAPM